MVCLSGLRHVICYLAVRSVGVGVIWVLGESSWWFTRLPDYAFPIVMEIEQIVHFL